MLLHYLPDLPGMSIQPTLYLAPIDFYLSDSVRYSSTAVDGQSGCNEPSSLTSAGRKTGCACPRPLVLTCVLLRNPAKKHQ